MTVTVALEADLATLTTSTVVALPPSDLDPGSIISGTIYDNTTEYDGTTVYDAEYSYDLMRVYINGTRYIRSFDPEMVQP